MNLSSVLKIIINIILQLDILYFFSKVVFFPVVDIPVMNSQYYIRCFFIL